MRKIIADSSSLILLYKCGAAEYYLNNSCCIIPEPVRDELTAPNHEGSDFFKQCIIKKTLTVIIPSCNLEPDKKMHKGESGVIFLYKEGAVEYVLIDDGYGAEYCRDNGIPYINALLVVKLLFLSGKISEEGSAGMFNWLKKNGRYSKAVIEWAEKAGAEELKYFLF